MKRKGYARTPNMISQRNFIPTACEGSHDVELNAYWLRGENKMGEKLVNTRSNNSQLGR